MCANLGPANAARARTHLEEKVAELESRLRYYEQRCQLLEKIIARIDPSLIPSRVVSTQTRLLQQEKSVASEGNDVHGCQESVAEMFFRELQANAARNPHGRRVVPVAADGDGADGRLRRKGRADMPRMYA